MPEVVWGQNDFPEEGTRMLGCCPVRRDRNKSRAGTSQSNFLSVVFLWKK